MLPALGRAARAVSENKGEVVERCNTAEIDEKKYSMINMAHFQIEQ